MLHSNVLQGKDVDSIISDLLRASLSLEKAKRKQRSKLKVAAQVEDKLLDALLGSSSGVRERDSFRTLLRGGALESSSVEVEVPVKEPEMTGNNTLEKFSMAISSQIQSSSRGARRTETRRLAISDARLLLEEVELDAMAAQDDVVKAAIKSVEEDGIVFIDEIDKIASSSHSRSADASADGVQRDLLPLIEGTTITTKHGDVRTDHILFVASGSFHAVKPGDLLAELQGRLPVRVELQGLTEDDLHAILTRTEHNLIRQQTALLAVEKVQLRFTPEAVRSIARVAAEVNRTLENIGARRLATVVERIVGPHSYEAADLQPGTEIVVDEHVVQERVADLLKSADLQKYIL